MKKFVLFLNSLVTRYSLLATILCIMQCALCIDLKAQNEYPIIEKNGEKYYEYTVNPGEGLFAIARKFGIKQNDLHEANENLTTNIKVGDKILVPIKNNNLQQTTEIATTHIVEAKQTLYSISKMYNVNIDTLIALNPSAKAGIKIGETLIISKDKKIKLENTVQQPVKVKNTATNNITHIVQRKETLYSISKKYNVAIHDLITINPELKDGLKAGSEILIKGEKLQTETITPSIESIDTIKSIESINTIDTINTSILNSQLSTLNSQLNIAYLLPLVAENTNDEKNTQRFVEFYRGSLLALEKAKTEGLSANILTYNLPKSVEKIDSILQLLKDKNIDVVIGPAYTEQLSKVLSYTKEHDITTIVPFSSKIDTTYYFPKLIQFNPPQDSLFNSVLTNTITKAMYLQTILLNYSPKTANTILIQSLNLLMLILLSQK